MSTSYIFEAVDPTPLVMPNKLSSMLRMGTGTSSTGEMAERGAHYIFHVVWKTSCIPVKVTENPIGLFRLG